MSVGFKRAIDARCPRVAVPPGPRCVVLPTYNGSRKLPNLVLLAAEPESVVGMRAPAAPAVGIRVRDLFFLE